MVQTAAPSATGEGRTAMADPTDGAQTAPAAGGAGAGFERVPVMQRVLDNPFLLLFIGVTVPTVFYLIWGILEVAQVPIAK